MDSNPVTDLILRELSVLKTNSNLQHKMLQSLSEPAELVIKGIPIKCNEDLQLIEDKLNDPTFRNKLEIYFRKKYTKKNQRFLPLLKNVASDKFLINYNYDGGYDKKSFKELKLIDVLFAAWGHNMPENEYEKEMRNPIPCRALRWIMFPSTPKTGVLAYNAICSGTTCSLTGGCYFIDRFSHSVISLTSLKLLRTFSYMDNAFSLFFFKIKFRLNQLRYIQLKI